MRFNSSAYDELFPREEVKPEVPADEVMTHKEVQKEEEHTEEAKETVVIEEDKEDDNDGNNESTA